MVKIFKFFEKIPPPLLWLTLDQVKTQDSVIVNLQYKKNGKYVIYIYIKNKRYVKKILKKERNSDSQINLT